MVKIFSLYVFLFLLSGCASNYHLNEKKELGESEKKNRYLELEQIIKKIKPGDEVILSLYNGDTVGGTFYSYMDGFVSLRMDDAFRDVELVDLKGLSIQPKDRMKTTAMVLVFVAVAAIVTTFIVTH